MRRRYMLLPQPRAANVPDLSWGRRMDDPVVASRSGRWRHRLIAALRGPSAPPPLTRAQFIVLMAIRIARAGKLRAKHALPIASAAYREFVTSEGIKFGAAGYAWDEQAAATIADEFEIEHWESHPSALSFAGGEERA